MCAKPATLAIPFDPTPEHWLAAAQALRAGDPAPVVQMLLNLDLPLRLKELFAAVVADEKICRERIAAYDEGEKESDLEQEQAALFRWQPGSLEEAQKAAARRAELPTLLSRAMQRRVLNELAIEQLAALEAGFPELFSGEDVQPQKHDLNFPAATGNILRRDLEIDYFLGQTWRNALRPAEQQAAKRKLRISGIHQASRSRTL